MPHDPLSDIWSGGSIEPITCWVSISSLALISLLFGFGLGLGLGLVVIVVLILVLVLEVGVLVSLLLSLLLAVIESVLFARLSEIGVGVEVDIDEDGRVSIEGIVGILSVVVVVVAD